MSASWRIEAMSMATRPCQEIPYVSVGNFPTDDTVLKDGVRVGVSLTDNEPCSWSD